MSRLLKVTLVAMVGPLATLLVGAFVTLIVSAFLEGTGEGWLAFFFIQALLAPPGATLTGLLAWMASPRVPGPQGRVLLRHCLGAAAGLAGVGAYFWLGSGFLPRDAFWVGLLPAYLVLPALGAALASPRR